MYHDNYHSFPSIHPRVIPVYISVIPRPSNSPITHCTDAACCRLLLPLPLLLLLPQNLELQKPTIQCSVGCGAGLATRNVTCSNGRTSANVCDFKHKPSNVKPCETHSFCRWNTGRWNRVGSTSNTRTPFWGQTLPYNGTLNFLCPR